MLRPAAVLGWRQVPCWTGWQRPPFLPVLLAPPHPHPILIGPATSGANCPAAMRTYSPPRRPAEVLLRCLAVPPRSPSHRETVPRHWWRWQTAFPAPAPAAASLSRCPAASPDRATTAGLGHGHARQGAGAVVSPVRGGVGNPGPAGRGPPGPPDRLEGRE